MRVFVTGASGFIGGHVVEALSREHEVLAMARSSTSAEAARKHGATPITCQLGEVAPEQLAGVEAIVHCAARAEDWGTREQFWTTNVEGTRQLLDAAREAGVRRFIHISTEATLFDGHDLRDVDETHPYPARHRFLYSETKAEAERLVVAANTPEFTTIALRPRLVWGPRDQTILPAILEAVEAGAFAWIDRGEKRTSTTHVANLVHAIELALTHGRGGEIYFIADDERSTMREFLTRLVATAGAELPDRSLPAALARPLAGAVEGLWRVFRPGRRPPMSRLAIAMLSCDVTVETGKARAELGYAAQVGVDEGLRGLGSG